MKVYQKIFHYLTIKIYEMLVSLINLIINVYLYHTYFNTLRRGKGLLVFYIEIQNKVLLN